MRGDTNNRAAMSLLPSPSLTSRTTSRSVGPAAMLTFGGGIHYCLGAHLARLELAQALTVITRRMPNPHRSGPAPWKPITGITGPTTLPIEFDVGH